MSPVELDDLRVVQLLHQLDLFEYCLELRRLYQFVLLVNLNG